MTTTRRREYMQALGGVAAAGAVGLSGCLGSLGGSTGTLSTTVKDAPGDIADFESCVITIEGIWLKSGEGEDEDDEDADAGGDGGTNTSDDGVVEQDEGDVDQGDGREYHEFDEPATADLVELQNGNSSVVDDREIETGTYAFLQLDVSSVDATLAEGGDASVGTPGEAPLQFKESFEIRENTTTTFVADFTPVKRGETGTYLLQPVASGTEVSYEDDESDGGDA